MEFGLGQHVDRVAATIGATPTTYKEKDAVYMLPRKNLLMLFGMFALVLSVLGLAVSSYRTSARHAETLARHQTALLFGSQVSSSSFALEQAGDSAIMAELAIYEMLEVDSASRVALEQMMSLCPSDRSAECAEIKKDHYALLDSHLEAISEALDHRADTKNAALRRMQGKIAHLFETISGSDESELSAAMSEHALGIVFESTEHLKKQARKLVVNRVRTVKRKKQNGDDDDDDDENFGLPAGFLPGHLKDLMRDAVAHGLMSGLHFTPEAFETLASWNEHLRMDGELIRIGAGHDRPEKGTDGISHDPEMAAASSTAFLQKMVDRGELSFRSANGVESEPEGEAGGKVLKALLQQVHDIEHDSPHNMHHFVLAFQDLAKAVIDAEHLAPARADWEASGKKSSSGNRRAMRAVVELLRGDDLSTDFSEHFLEQLGQAREDILEGMAKDMDLDEDVLKLDEVNDEIAQHPDGTSSMSRLAASRKMARGRK